MSSSIFQDIYGPPAKPQDQQERRQPLRYADNASTYLIEDQRILRPPPQSAYSQPGVANGVIYPEATLDDINTGKHTARGPAPYSRQPHPAQPQHWISPDLPNPSQTQVPRSHAVASQHSSPSGQSRTSPMPPPPPPSTPRSRMPNTNLDMSLPEIRAIPWRAGYNPPVNEKSCRSIALNAVVRGTVAESTCTRCQKGRGPFTKCIILEGEFGGSCCSCKFTGIPGECSFVRWACREMELRAVGQGICWKR